MHVVALFPAEQIIAAVGAVRHRTRIAVQPVVAATSIQLVIIATPRTGDDGGGVTIAMSALIQLVELLISADAVRREVLTWESSWIERVLPTTLIKAPDFAAGHAQDAARVPQSVKVLVRFIRIDLQVFLSATEVHEFVIDVHRILPLESAWVADARRCRLNCRATH